MSPNELSEKAGLAALNVVRYAAAAVGEVAFRVLPAGNTLEDAAEYQRSKDEANAAIAQLSCRVVEVALSDAVEQRQ